MSVWVGWAALFGMSAAFLWLGWRSSRKAEGKSVDELMVAGRAMPLWVAALTMTATWLDGGYLLGTSEYVYKHGLAVGLQGCVCFGISLILGGIFFASRMRRLEYHTMIDLFEARFGPRWAAALSMPAVLGELFWSGALLVGLGASLSELFGMDIQASIITAATVVTLYVIWGGIWSVAYTDILQLSLVPIGMGAALYFAIPEAGGWSGCLNAYVEGKQAAALPIPPLRPDGGLWSGAAIIGWWDVTIMLILGGIPWNCYFQRVLSCRTASTARWHSITSGALTIILAVPAVFLGMAAFVHFGPEGIQPASAALPRLLKEMTPPFVMLLGLAAIVGAITSSHSASILSAGSMLGWNVRYRLLAPDARGSPDRLKSLVRIAILLLSIAATVLALRVRSVAALWLFTGDLVFVLLFPQLLWALFDPKANRIGSIVAFAVSLALRLGGGVALETDQGAVGFPALLPYSDQVPVRIISAAAGLILLPIVSRLTAAWNAPRPLRYPDQQPQ